MINKLLEKYKENYKVMLLNLFLVSIISILAINIHSSYTKGIANIRNTEKENRELQALLKKQEDLKGQEAYYSSTEYQKKFLRDNLNMAKDDETIYEIREIEDTPNNKIEQQEQKGDRSHVLGTMDNRASWRQYFFKL